MAHYIHDEKNNRIEGLSKEEIYALLAAAIQEGQLPSVDEDTAFVTMIKSIVDGKPYKIGFCTQAQYNELEAQGLLEADAYYVITDDETYDDIETALNNLSNDIASMQDTLTALQNALDNAELSIVNLQERVGVLEGKHLYRHDITYGGLLDYFYINFTLYTNSNTPLTVLTLKDYLTSNKPINAGGFVCDANDVKHEVMYFEIQNTTYFATRLDSSNNLPNSISVGGASSTNTHTFSDVVTTLF